MSDRRLVRASRPAAVLMAAALSLGVLAGCNNEPDDDASSDDPSTSSPTSETPTSDEPTESTPTEPTESAEETTTPDDDPSDSTPARAKKAQIPARQLPGFNDEWKWTKQTSGSGPGQDMPSVCMRAPFTAIGAVDNGEYRTDFDSPLSDDAWAVQMTAVFPDEQTAITTESVLEAWQKKCAKNAKSLGLKQVKVTSATEVPTDTGPGQQWLVTYGPVAGDPDAAWMQAEGFVRDGDTLTYLVMTTAGQDYNYEAGDEPVAQALEVAAQRLVASR